MSHEDRDWYILRPEIRSKALRLSDLVRLVHRGALKQTDFVRHSEWEEWIPAAEIPDLHASFKAGEMHGRLPDGTTGNTERDHGASRQKGGLSRLGRELASYAGVALYLWIILLMLELHEQVVLNHIEIGDEEGSRLLVHALILGKVVLIAEIIRIGARIAWPNALLSILFRSVLFALAMFLFHLLEDVIEAIWHGRSVLSGFARAENIQKDIVVIAIMAIALLPYHFFKELQKQTGEAGLLRLLLRSDTRSSESRDRAG